MLTDKKIKILCGLLYTYGALYVGLNLSNFIPPIELEMHEIARGFVHGAIFLAVAYYLPRKPGKATYWASAALIGFQLLRQVAGVGLLVWLRTTEFAPSMGAFFYILAAISFILLFASAVLLLQRDVRQKLTTAVTPPVSV